MAGLLEFLKGGEKPRAFVSGLLGGDTTELNNALASIRQLGNPDYTRNIKPISQQEAFDIGLMALTSGGQIKDALNVSDYGMYHRPPMKDNGGAPLHDLTGGGQVYPDDIYSPMAARYYGTGEDIMDRQTINTIKALRNSPDTLTTMYRAIPDFNKNVNNQLKQLNNIVNYKNKFGFFPMKDNIYNELRSKYPIENFSYEQQQANVLNDINAKIFELQGQVKKRPSINNGDWVTINKQYAKEHGESALGGNYIILSKKVPARKLFTNGDSIHEFGYDETGLISPSLLGLLAASSASGIAYAHDKKRKK